jgi:hypothetical protein
LLKWRKVKHGFLTCENGYYVYWETDGQRRGGEPEGYWYVEGGNPAIDPLCYDKWKCFETLLEAITYAESIPC